MSEARRGIKRIAANYGRLGATMLIGLALVPVQFAWVGVDGFGLLVAIGASAGLAAMLQDIMRHSMVRELGTVWHATNEPGAGPDELHHFKRVYASAFVLCSIVALLTIGIFSFFLWLITDAVWPFDNLPQEYRAAGQWILVAEGISITLLVLLAPAYNMYVVTERFFESNLWFTLKRLAYLASAVTLYLTLGSSQVELSLKLYGVCVAGLSILVLCFAVGRIVLADKRLRPKLQLADRTAFREIIGTFGWNGSVVTAMNLHERVGIWIMLGCFGLWGSTIFGLAMRLVSYVRMLTLGMTYGLDAVSARLSTSQDEEAMKSIVRHSTRLHGYVAIPAAITIFLLAEPLLRLWVGRAVIDPDPETGREIIGPAVILVKIMVVGLLSRAIADGWMKLLYGAGHIQRYAPLILSGGIANPILAFVLITLLPDSINWTGAAISFGCTFLIVHLGLLPLVTARFLGTTWHSMLGMLWRPCVLASIPATIFAVVLLWPTPVPWWIIALACLAYAVAYGLLGIYLGLETQERARVLRVLGRTLHRSQAQ